MLSVIKHFKEETHIMQNVNICNIFLLVYLYLMITGKLIQKEELLFRW